MSCALAEHYRSGGGASVGAVPSREEEGEIMSPTRAVDIGTGKKRARSGRLLSNGGVAPIDPSTVASSVTTDPKKGFGYVPPRTCGACTVDMACAPYSKAGMACVAPRAHGGAGLILSRGLLEAVSLDKVRYKFIR